MAPPTVYRQWDLLRDKILRLEEDSAPVRDDEGRALIFEVAMVAYNPEYRILGDDIVNNWVRHVTLADNSTGPDEAVRDEAPSQDDTPDSEESCTESQDSSQAATAVCISSIDALVLNEPIEDEFAKYDYEDDVETLQSKNLKKIRAEPEPKPKPKPVIKPKSPEKFTLKDPKPEIQTPAPKIIEPNWPETAKLLKENRLVDVFKDLNHFKNHIKTDQAPRALLKEAIQRCFGEDETVTLSDLMGLMFECDYCNDLEFWAEVIMRLKRKLVSHSDVRKFKTKMDPDRVLENYRTIITSVRGYACSVDLTLKLPYHAMKFFLESSRIDTGSGTDTPMQLEKPLDDVQVPDKAPPDSNSIHETKPVGPSLQQDQKLSLSILKPQDGYPNPASSNSASGVTNSKPNLLATNRSIKLEPPVENIDPATERDVVMVRNAKGGMSFKVRRKISTIKALSKGKKL